MIIIAVTISTRVAVIGLFLKRWNAVQTVLPYTVLPLPYICIMQPYSTQSHPIGWLSLFKCASIYYRKLVDSTVGNIFELAHL